MRMFSAIKKYFIFSRAARGFTPLEVKDISADNRENEPLTGFTIIEMIVVIAIFLFIIVAGVSLFLAVIQAQRSVLAQQQLLSQVSYAEEYMSKGLRMAKTEVNELCLLDSQKIDHVGYIYLLTHYNPTRGVFEGIKFINQSDSSACQEFYLDENGMLQETRTLPGGSSVTLPLTGSSLKINYIKFSINGSDGSANSAVSGSVCPSSGGQDDCGAWASIFTDIQPQPKVTIILNVTDNEGTSRDMETTISRRNLNLPQ